MSLTKRGDDWLLQPTCTPLLSVDSLWRFICVTEHKYAPGPICEKVNQPDRRVTRQMDPQPIPPKSWRGEPQSLIRLQKFSAFWVVMQKISPLAIDPGMHISWPINSTILSIQRLRTITQSAGMPRPTPTRFIGTRHMRHCGALDPGAGPSQRSLWAKRPLSL